MIKQHKIILAEHKSLDWIEDGNLNIRGWIYDNDGFHEKEALRRFGYFGSEDHFKDWLESSDGNFSIIYDNGEAVFAAVDRITSFSLFYAMHNETLLLSDSIAMLSNKTGYKEVDETSLNEFRATGLILEDRTLYKNIYKLEAGQYLVLDKKTNQITIKDYFLHLHNNPSSQSEEELCLEYDTVILDVFRRMVDSINGRKIVLFLSGGLDSRLIAVTLRRLNYDNVLCVTYGKHTDYDVLFAKQVAQECGYPWKLIVGDKKYWRKKRKSGELMLRFERAKNDISYPYIPGMMLDGLIKEGNISKDCVVVTGYSGDVLQGDRISRKFVDGITYTREDVSREIRDRYFYHDGYKRHSGDIYNDGISRYLLGETEFTAERLEDICEFFNWRVRQSQYIVHDMRNYDDNIGCEWRFPLWDKAYFAFWQKVPYHLRCGRKLHYSYIQQDVIPNTSTSVSTLKKAMISFKKRFPFISRLVYPIKGLFEYLFSAQSGNFPYGVIYFREFLKIMRRTKGYMICSTHAVLYLTLKWCYNIDYN